MRKISFLLIGLLLTIQVLAFRVEYGNNIIISQPVYDNLYIAGATVTINAPIHGDLVIVGGTVIINDSVINDILLIGATVKFNGFVGGDIRCAGGKIKINKNITGDLVISSGTVIIDKGVTVGNLLGGGASATIDGNINGEARGAFGEIYLNGNIAKDINCRAGKITVNGSIAGKSVLAAPDIIIESNAAFNHDVRYWNRKGSLDFKQSLKNSNALYDESLHIQTAEWYYLGAATVLGLLWYLGMALLMIMIVQYLFAATMKKAADSVFNNTLKSLGFGFLFFIAVPLAAVVACITIIGVPVGLLLIFNYLVLVLLTSVIISVVAANWFNNRKKPKWHYGKMVFVAGGIFIVLKLIASIPFLGSLLMLVLACIAYGAILLNVKFKRPGLQDKRELPAV